MQRRTVLAGLCSLATAAGAGCTFGEQAATDDAGGSNDGSGDGGDGSGSVPTVEVADQVSNGESIRVDRAAVEGEASLVVTHVESDAVIGTESGLSAGEHENVSVTLGERLESNATVRVDLDRQRGRTVAEDRADVTLQPDPSLSVSWQHSDGETVVVEELSTDVEAELVPIDADGEELEVEQPTVPARTVGERREVELSDPLSEHQAVEVVLRGPDGERLAADDGYVRVADEPPYVVVHDQTTSGRAVTVRRVATDVDGSLFAFDEDGEEIGGSGVTVGAGRRLENVTIPLDEELEESQTVEVWLFESNGPVIAEGEATVTVEE